MHDPSGQPSDALKLEDEGIVALPCRGCKDADDLPGNDEELSRFLGCVEKAFRRAGGGEDLFAALAAVRACLPDRISTMGREFVVR